jgi:hypothetical protein
MPPEGENIESIRNAKRKAAELADTTLSLINSEALETAATYYLTALEEVGKIKILQSKLGNEIGTFEDTRDSRIQAALDHLGRELYLNENCATRPVKYSLSKGIHQSKHVSVTLNIKSSNEVGISNILIVS